MATTLQALLEAGIDADYLSGLSDQMRSRLARNLGLDAGSDYSSQPYTPPPVQSEILNPFGAYNWDRFGSLASKQTLVSRMLNDGFSVQQIRDEISRIEPDKSALTESNFELLGLKSQPPAQPAQVQQTVEPQGLLSNTYYEPPPPVYKPPVQERPPVEPATATVAEAQPVALTRSAAAAAPQSEILRPFGAYNWDRFGSLASKQALVQNMRNDGYSVQQIRDEISRLEPDRSALTERNFELLGLAAPVAAPPAATTQTGLLDTATTVAQPVTASTAATTQTGLLDTATTVAQPVTASTALDTTAQSAQPTLDRGATVRTQQDSTASVQPSTILRPFGQYEWDRTASLADKQALVQRMINDGFTPTQVRNEISRLEPDRSALTESNFELLGLAAPTTTQTTAQQQTQTTTQTTAQKPAQTTTQQPSRVVNIFGLDWDRDATLEQKRGLVQQLLAMNYTPAQIRSEIIRLDPTPVEATSFEALGIPIPTTTRSTTERTGGTRLESGEMQYNIAPITDYEQRSALAPTGLLSYGYGPEQGLFSDIATRPEVRETQAANLAAMQAAAPTAGLLAANQAVMTQARQASTGSPLTKAAFYNQLRSQGYSDQQIQNLVGASIGYQTPQDFNYLRQLGQTVQMAPQLQQRTAEGKASYFNDLLNSGLNYDQALSVINTGIGQQSNQDLLELTKLASAQRAQPMAMLGTAPGAFSQGLLAGGFPSVAGQTLLGFGAT